MKHEMLKHMMSALKKNVLVELIYNMEKLKIWSKRPLWLMVISQGCFIRWPALQNDHF